MECKESGQISHCTGEAGSMYPKSRKPGFATHTTNLLPATPDVLPAP